MNDYANGARFAMGRVFITPSAEAALHAVDMHPIRFLARHLCGDWGNLPVEDLAANEMALLTGKRVLSSYDLPGDGRIWIITDANRSVTTILLPVDY